MKKYIFSLILAGLLANFCISFAADEMCAQVIQSAKNPITWECKDYPTPCDVPSDWEKVDSCKNSSDLIVNGVNLWSCKSYFDWCNTCSVGEDWQSACTLMACEKQWTPECLDVVDDKNIEDTTLIDIDESQTKDLQVNFNLQKFNSCEDFTSKVKDYIKNYTEFYPYSWFYRWWAIDDVLMEDSVAPSSWIWSDKVSSNISSDESEIKATDYSSTNTQIIGVDESEIIKTDWKYIYFYNSDNHSIYVTNSYPANELKIVKKINLPRSFSNPEIYIQDWKLVVIANKYFTWNYSYYWFERNYKTVVVVYNISDLNKLKIEKYYQVDGSISKSRKIWKYLYILSQSSFSFPYRTYFSDTKILNESQVNSDLSSAKKLLPKKAELRITQDIKEKNVNIKWTSDYYNLSQNYTSKCADIEYLMPDKDTLKNFNFTPSYTTLSIIDLEDSSKEVKTKLLFWDVSEIFMSLENLYITSNLYTNYNFKCPEIRCIKAPCPAVSCIMPYYNMWNNTLIHKMNIAWDSLKYQTSNIVPWSPLNQYSMDEKDGNFRIVTSSYTPLTSTNLFILDKELKLTWKIQNIAKWENFQSSRFISDKLYLVTFKQIDPLFVIDLKDVKNPKILWELKIPGYSTYLHPYDTNHLIWLWYDTKENQWWWTVNSWIKIDLYDISDFNNPKQKYTLTMWDQSSYSEVLNNPRLFVWNSKNNTLFMPVTLYNSANDSNNYYRYSNAMQWSVAVKIDKDSWIKKLAEITHIDSSWLEEKRKEECSKYSVEETPKCEKLINWETYCPPVKSYVPEYCYASSSIWEYFANKLWNYSKSFILRNLYLGNVWYTISNEKIQANDINSNFTKISEVNMK